ncbi:hydroxyisourate hydrolase [Cryobacterium psychrophilum]|uniref:5-hydroxyisourate hydrolase n=1 Tax=Cryobacterium psychrophilum TaxID=41988 RepID=A0A4Y8KQI8_9MICO|nr:hydroxyisourate hydrolase [Cryobacterium psychrophilum]TDW30184.1 5-hydroxyisourate hydrolase [Cryobacterium psychrophilum]TFD77413.1 hydroxyisourate hydrolase [Cryobacterium psychrophilum]
MSRSFVTTHILDTVSGRPAAGVSVELLAAADGWSQIASGVSDADGRVNGLGPDILPPGRYRLEFATGEYFAGRQLTTFFPEVVVTFSITAGEAHYHVPLLLAPFTFSTYKGS